MRLENFPFLLFKCVKIMPWMYGSQSLWADFHRKQDFRKPGDIDSFLITSDREIRKMD